MKLNPVLNCKMLNREDLIDSPVKEKKKKPFRETLNKQLEAKVFQSG